VLFVGIVTLFSVWSLWNLIRPRDPTDAVDLQLLAQLQTEMKVTAMAGSHPALGHPLAESDSNGRVLILARTFHGHTSVDMTQFVLSLQSLRFTDWELQLLNTDSRPLGTSLHDVISAFGDPRIKVYGGQDFVAPRAYDNWYSAYDLCDKAVREIASKAKHRWVLFTNADNMYMPEALDFLDISYDIVGMDLFQRTHVDALAHSYKKNSCMSNTMGYAGTDLGANILSLPKLISEDWKFFSLVQNDLPYGPEDKVTPDAGIDGRMVQHLLEAGWQALHVARCMFSHAPNPWMCKHAGKVWYDHPMRSHASCLDWAAAQKMAQTYKDLHLLTQQLDMADYLTWDPLPQNLTAESWAYEKELTKILKERLNSKPKMCPPLVTEGHTKTYTIRNDILCSNRYAQTIEAGYVFLPEVYLAKNRDLPWRDSNVNQRPALIEHFKQKGINQRRCHGWRDHNGNEHLHPWCGKGSLASRVSHWFPCLEGTTQCASPPKLAFFKS